MKKITGAVALINFIGSIAGISGVTLLWFKTEYQITAAAIAGTTLTVLILLSVLAILTITLYAGLATWFESLNMPIKLGVSIVILTLLVAYWGISIKIFSIMQPVIVRIFS